MLRASLFVRCTAITPSSVQRVTAWFAHTPLDLDVLEAALRSANMGNVIRLTPQLGQGTRRQRPRDELLLFSVEPAPLPSTAAAPSQPATSSQGTATQQVNTEAARTPDMLLDSLRTPSPDWVPLHRKAFVVFRDGIIVGWNSSSRDLAAIAGEAAAAVDASEARALSTATQKKKNKAGRTAASETLKFRVGGDTHIDVDTDTIVLADEHDELKLPFSYALAQSLRIDVVDVALKPVVVNVKAWQRELGATGHMTCSVKQLRKTKAQLLSVYDDMDFSHVQTTPKLFWMPEYQQLRSHYKLARSHLEIEGRLEVLTDRAEAVNDALDYLSGEVHSEANEFGTWVIIWMIGFEILLALGLHNLLNLLTWSWHATPEPQPANPDSTATSTPDAPAAKSTSAS
jgi:uncharacterized Rmd1/YagE family protein